MNECTWLSNRIPAVASGGSQWTPEERQHLNRCALCRREWELVQLAGRLGDGVLPALDVDAITGHLRRRLAPSGSSGRRSWGLVGLAAAASIGVLLWIGEWSPVSRIREDPAASALYIPLPELEGLPPGELDSLLRDMDRPTDITVTEYELGDLDSTELQVVLESWEG